MLYIKRSRLKSLLNGWMGGWVDGWVDGWMEGKAGLRIAYSNQKNTSGIQF
jgi:beta-glucanase (GH16 family)